MVVVGFFGGTMLTCGSFTLTNSDPSGATDDLFVARLSPTGTWLQATQAGSIGDEQPTALALDAAGTAVVAGNFRGATVAFGTNALTNSGPTGNADLFVARLSAAGTWTQAVAASSPSGKEIRALAVDAGGTAVVVGDFAIGAITFGPTTLNNTGTGGERDLFVARLSPAGTWTQAVRAGGPEGESARAVALQADGTAVVAGSFSSASGSTAATFGTFVLTPQGNQSNLYVARLNAAGTWTQAVAAGGAGATFAARAVAVDAAGNVVVTGDAFDRTSTNVFLTFGAGLSLPFTGNSGFVVARLSAAGTWIQAVGGGLLSGSASGTCGSLVQDASGNVVVSGLGRDGLQLGSLVLTSTAIRAVYVARLNPAGTWTQVTAAGGDGVYGSGGLGVDAAGNATVAGRFEGVAPEVAVFGSFTFAPARTTNAFVAQLGALPLASKGAAAAEPVIIAPNPARGFAQLRLPAAPTARTVLLLDAVGRQVHSQALPARTSSATLDLTGLAAGLY